MSSPPKRPPLTALLRAQAQPVPTPEEQQRIQAENDRKLYGVRAAPLPAAPQEPATGLSATSAGQTSSAALTAPTAPANGRWVPFGSYLHAEVYLQLKQAEFWEPGFEIRQFVNNALEAALQALPSAQQPLPAAQLEALQKKKRKLTS